jgi:actin-related protein
VYELREEVKNLREEVKHMLGMVKDLKEEIDVDRVRKQGNDREEVKKLMTQIEKHREGTSTRLSDAYENQKRLLEMVRDLKEEFELDKATRFSHAGTVRPKEQTIEEGNEGTSWPALASLAWKPPAS